MPKTKTRFPGKVRRQLVLPRELDDKLRNHAHLLREWPSTTGGRLIAMGLGMDPVALGLEPTDSNGSPPA